MRPALSSLLAGPAALPAFWRQSLATMLQYRGEIALWAVWGVVYPAVAMAMWAAAVRGAPGGREIGGFGPAEFAAYFWLTMVVGHTTTAWDVYEFGYMVQSGALSPKLLRPVLPVWQSVADNLAFKVLTLAVLVPLWAVVVLVSRPSFSTDWRHVAMGVPAVLLAAAINYIWCYNIAMLAFWVTRLEAIGQAWFGAGLFFGGRLAPLEIMPPVIGKIAAALPFKWVTWFPCETIMGKIKPATVAMGLLNQIGWIALGLALFAILWRRGIRRYSAVGA